MLRKNIKNIFYTLTLFSFFVPNILISKELKSPIQPKQDFLIEIPAKFQKNTKPSEQATRPKVEEKVIVITTKKRPYFTELESKLYQYIYKDCDINHSEEECKKIEIKHQKKYDIIFKDLDNNTDFSRDKFVFFRDKIKKISSNNKELYEDMMLKLVYYWLEKQNINKYYIKILIDNISEIEKKRIYLDYIVIDYDNINIGFTSDDSSFDFQMNLDHFIKKPYHLYQEIINIDNMTKSGANEFVNNFNTILETDKDFFKLQDNQFYIEQIANNIKKYKVNEHYMYKLEEIIKSNMNEDLSSLVCLNYFKDHIVIGFNIDDKYKFYYINISYKNRFIKTLLAKK